MGNANLRKRLLSILLCMLACNIPHVSAQNAQVDAAHFLADNKPFLYPYVELGLKDPDKRKAAAGLIASQTSALIHLKGCQDVSIIPLLITYLNYTTGVLPPSRFGTNKAHLNASTSPNIQLLSENWPAFGVIVNIHDSDKMLATYVRNGENSPNYRLAALLILRYLNPGEFAKCFSEFDDEFKDAVPSVRGYLKAIEAGTVSFDGVLPIVETD